MPQAFPVLVLLTVLLPTRPLSTACPCRQLSDEPRYVNSCPSSLLATIREPHRHSAHPPAPGIPYWRKVYICKHLIIPALFSPLRAQFTEFLLWVHFIAAERFVLSGCPLVCLCVFCPLCPNLPKGATSPRHRSCAFSVLPGRCPALEVRAWGHDYTPTDIINRRAKDGNSPGRGSEWWFKKWSPRLDGLFPLRDVASAYFLSIRISHSERLKQLGKNIQIVIGLCFTIWGPGRAKGLQPLPASHSNPPLFQSPPWDSVSLKEALVNCDIA